MRKIWILAAYRKEPIDRINRTAFEYVEVLEKAGAVPWIVPCNVRDIEPYLRDLDAFVFPGGSDIDPSVYGETLDGSNECSKGNDEFLLRFMKAATEMRKPVLGICKGMQLVNVLFGGKLSQNLPSAVFHDQYERQYETVDAAILTNDGFLANVFGQGKIPINSLHHQAVSVLGDGLKIAAVSEYDGTVEAIEHATFPVYGIQWHPECLPQQQMLFNWFVRTVSRPLFSHV